MTCLYIDTSSSYLYTGLVRDGHLLIETKKDYGQQLSVEALPQVSANFEAVGMLPAEVDTIIVVDGPGSFTGIRIGITIAKVMAWSLGKKIIPISGLMAMALSAKSSATYLVPMIDARRDYVYGAIYDRYMHPVLADGYLNRTELEQELRHLTSVQVITNNSFDTAYSKESYDPDLVKIVEFCKDRPAVLPHLVNPCYLKCTEAEEKVDL